MAIFNPSPVLHVSRNKTNKPKKQVTYKVMRLKTRFMFRHSLPCVCTTLQLQVPSWSFSTVPELILSSNTSFLSFPLTRIQFPCTFAWLITSHDLSLISNVTTSEKVSLLIISKIAIPSQHFYPSLNSSWHLSSPSLSPCFCFCVLPVSSTRAGTLPYLAYF